MRGAAKALKGKGSAEFMIGKQFVGRALWGQLVAIYLIWLSSFWNSAGSGEKLGCLRPLQEHASAGMGRNPSWLNKS